MSLVIPLLKNGGPLFRQIYAALRNAILSGAFHAGDQLPSTRDLAEQLGVSRTIVLIAYDQLLAEGFVTGRPGSGTYVAQGLGANAGKPAKSSARLQLSRFGGLAAESEITAPHRRSSKIRYDFIYGRSPVDAFPFAMWRRILLRRARQAPARELDYGPAAGSIDLREAIASHLRRSRAVVCEPEQVIVVNGSQQALDLIVRVLIERGDRVAIEDPQYQGTRELLRAAGAKLLPVPVDREGVDTSRLPENTRVAFVTPSHQFPTGTILPLARRLALLEWAKQANAAIIEDDYDGEFRYDGQPLESLQGLDTEGRVIYVGTFSRTIFSSLRIGYLIAPKPLVSTLTWAKWLCDRHTATLEQQTLAEFISTGTYERHLRQLRRRNASRRKAPLEAIGTHLGDRVEVTGDGAGAHVVLWPRARISEETLVTRAAEKGVGIYGIARAHLKSKSRPAALLGYSRLNEQEIREGICLLGEVF